MCIAALSNQSPVFILQALMLLGVSAALGTSRKVVWEAQEISVGVPAAPSLTPSSLGSLSQGHRPGTDQPEQALSHLAA